MQETDPYRHPVETPGFRSRFGGLWTDLSNARDLVAGRLAIGDISERDALNLLAFIESGYVILRGAVDDKVVDTLNADIARIVIDPPREAWVSCFENGHHVARPLRSEDAHAHNKELKLLDLYSFLPSAREVIFAPDTLRFLKLIFMRPALVHQSLFFFKGSQQQLHKDTAFVRVSSPMELVASWTALEDVRPGSGELIYYPGSHQDQDFLFEGKYKWCPPGATEIGAFYASLDEAAERRKDMRRLLRAAKGDVLIWSADLAHGGGEIDDPSKTRQSIVAHYCPKNVYPMYRHYEGASEITDYGNGRLGCFAKKGTGLPLPMASAYQGSANSGL
jgi:ectoine hydroxylase-related dioxygenase (phytanoyl-CoA dioxygenase family)